jgi:hypothetical protein
MAGIIIAPPSLRKEIIEANYFAALSEAAQWVLRAKTPILFDDLPSNAVEGWQAPILDSTTDTWGDTITGGGALHVLGYFDGTNWTVAAK